MEITAKEIAAIVGKRIDIALEARGMTAAELAKRTGISQQDISNYRHGRYAPRQRKLFVIATSLGVSPAWLMGLETDMYVKDELNYLWERMTDEQKEQALDYMRYLIVKRATE